MGLPGTQTLLGERPLKCDEAIWKRG